jgi:hypothetical protein
MSKRTAGVGTGKPSAAPKAPLAEEVDVVCRGTANGPVMRLEAKPKRRPRLLAICDVWGSLEAAAPVHHALQNYLIEHGIEYQRRHRTDAYQRECYRYVVRNAEDLCCAKAVLPALQALQEGCVREARP